MKALYEEICEINKQDPATHAERLGKLFEEAGELAKAVNMVTGRKAHKLTEEEVRKEIVEEAADAIQNVISVIDGFGIDYVELLDALALKNQKWRLKVSERNERR